MASLRAHQYWVYFLTNKGNTVLYIGVTSDIQQRIFDHRTGKDKHSFAWTYQCWKLIHLEEFNNITDTIAREKQLKNWQRKWKNELLEKENPEWKDLALDWDYSGWFDPADPPEGFYRQNMKENWGGPNATSAQGRSTNAQGEGVYTEP